MSYNSIVDSVLKHDRYSRHSNTHHIVAEDTLPRIDQFASIFPYEIVEEIFLLCRTPLEWGPGTFDTLQHPPAAHLPLLLSQVSKTWREIVHATPALWTDVCIHGQASSQLHPEMLKQILRYSKNRPLTACIIILGRGAEFIEWLDICMKELFRYSDRIRSFRLLVRFGATLWGEDVPIPHLPCLEEAMIDPSDLSPVRLEPLFNSPRLQKLTWLSSHYPEPLLRMGAQITELRFKHGEYSYAQWAAILEVCPNLSHVAVIPIGPIPLAPSPPVCLRDLHTFRSTEAGLYMCTAPNVRYLTLQLHLGNSYDMIHTRFRQFLSLSPRIEYLQIHLNRIFPHHLTQIILLTPCLATLKVTFGAAPDASAFNELFEMLSPNGASTLALPRLRHLTLDVADNSRHLVYDAEKLLHMLESRCNPNSDPIWRTRLD
ncbi:hypothetical protein BJ138DRAFT_1107998, partial [Hygrophoropsis aurantiaca]